MKIRKAIAWFFVLTALFSIVPLKARAADNSITWTVEELEFIRRHPVIRLGVDPQFVPFEFLDKDGLYKGITADYLDIISRKTGIRFEAAKGLTWPEAYESALEGKVDVLPAVSKTEEREKSFLFSEPYYYFRRVLVTRDSDTGISGIEDLKGLTVAVQRNSSHHSYLISNPKINLSLYDSAEAALEAVANGAERAFVGNLATTNYLIRSNGLTNLRFIAFEAEKQQTLHIAVRKDWPELVGILNKALASITEEEKISINNKWINLKSDADYGPIVRALVIAGVLLAVVLAVSLYWIMRLRNEVEKRKRIQEALERAKLEAEEANSFKSNFMARMSHEIRTPLNAIIGLSYLLKKTDITLTQKMYADRITQASTNMLTIINDILDFSKIEAGKAELENISFSLDQCIQEVVNIISYKIEEQEIGFRLTKDPLIPNWFIGDSKRIAQVLLNILNNAAKFTSSGEVSLDVRLTGKESDRYHIMFTVKDTGIGMSEEQVGRLFSPFSQGDVSINRRFGGTGLGLSIVKNLVDMMGGQIRVFSTEGEGSTFIVQLSLRADREKEEQYRRDLSAGHFKSIKTLVLEKTGSNMSMIESYLGAFGMRCELTTSPASATGMLEAANGNPSKPFDLFIIDYETPSEGAFEYIRSLRADRSIVRMPRIIMLLPMMREDLFGRLDEYGVDIGIGKPIIPSILFNAILDIFKLKAVSAAQPSLKTEQAVSAPGKPCLVLVAEDNKTNQLIAKTLLQQAGMEVLLASDGREALELFAGSGSKVDLVLMDLHMPVMNGYEAAIEIRKTSRDVPIVAMTADVILGVREKCEQSGIFHYISKPFDPERFIRTVRDIIEESRTAEKPEAGALDREAGLRNLGGNLEAYRQVLSEYLAENGDTAQRLALAITERRYEDAERMVHKIKSSSGSIGAKTFFDLCVVMQRALNDKNDIEIAGLQDKFLGELQRLLAEIKENE